MKCKFSSVPWNTFALWREVNMCLAHTIRQNQPALAECRRQVLQIKHLFELIFPLMDRLCKMTCPDCTNVCCQRAWVWADFRDLLFLHLAGIPLPDSQLVSRSGGHCRYADPDGCRLARIQRPYICTWYLCPAQTRLLMEQPTDKHRLTAVLHRIKEQRRQMEDAFIQAMMA